MAPDVQPAAAMKEICDHMKEHVDELVAEWDRLVVEEPWFALPEGHRVGELPEVIIGLVEASLCEPLDMRAHREKVNAAARHGDLRREAGLPEHLLLAEYNLLRQAIWHYLRREFPRSTQLTEAMLRIDSSLAIASNASLWGYHRPEIERMGKWEAGIERIVSSSPFLRGKWAP